MKFLILNASPRKGTSLSIAECIKDYLLEYDNSITFEILMLKDFDIPFCTGCSSCFYNGEDKCPHYKSVNEVVEKIKEADFLIITSSVYCLNVSGLLKNFLDHTSYFYHRPYFFDKNALVVVSTVGGGHKETSAYIRDNLKYWGFNKVYKFAIPLFSMSASINEDVKKKVRDYTKKMHAKLLGKKLYDVSLKRIMFYNMWRALSMSKDACPYDKKYWKESGLYKYPYSPNVRINPFSKFIGNIFYKLFSKLF